MPKIKFQVEEQLLADIVKNLGIGSLKKELINEVLACQRKLDSKLGQNTTIKGNPHRNGAAVALEYCLRKHQRPVDLKLLSKAVGCTQSNLKKLIKYSKYYLDDYQQPQSRATRQTKTRGAVASKPPNASIDRPPSKVPNLSIKLAAHLMDPHGCSQKAEGIMQYMWNDKGNRFDLSQFHQAYEAAAIYVVATDVHATKRGREDDPEHDDDVLQPRHVWEAAGCTQDDFQRVLPFVKDIHVKKRPRAKSTFTAATPTRKEEQVREAKISATEPKSDRNSEKTSSIVDWKTRILEGTCTCPQKYMDCECWSLAAQRVLERHGIPWPENRSALAASQS